MVTYYVKKGDIYTVTATANCAIYDANGSTFATCDAGGSVKFNAPTAKISLSDNHAVLSISAESAIDVPGVTEHISDGSIHVTVAEKTNWNNTVETFTKQSPIVDSHMIDSVSHVTAEERERWDSGGGMTQEQTEELERCVQHLENEDIHLTEAQREGLNDLLPAGSFDTLDSQPDGSGELNALLLPAEAVPHDAPISEVVLPAVANTNQSKACFLAAYSESADKTQKLLLGVSSYSVLWESGEDVRWRFSPGFVVPEGMALVLYLAATLADVGVTDVARPGVHVAARVKNEGSGSVRLDGMWYGSRTPLVRFVLGGHVADNVAHITANERNTWNNAPNLYAPKNLGVANAVVITDENGNIVASTFISVTELNTLNNNVTNIVSTIDTLARRVEILETA